MKSSDYPTSAFLQKKLLQAAITLAKQPQALQLRYLQTLTEISGEGSSTIVFPLPIDILDVFRASKKEAD